MKIRESRESLFAGKNEGGGRGKTGTNMFKWHDVFKHYFKKILSIYILCI